MRKLRLKIALLKVMQSDSGWTSIQTLVTQGPSGCGLTLPYPFSKKQATLGLLNCSVTRGKELDLSVL